MDQDVVKRQEKSVFNEYLHFVSFHEQTAEVLNLIPSYILDIQCLRQESSSVTRNLVQYLRQIPVHILVMNEVQICCLSQGI